MRDLFFKLFSDSYFNTGISITAFSIPHIVYLILIFGGITAACLVLRKRSEQSRQKALRLLCYALVLSYLSDFFFHDFVYGGLNMDKLPFHICTVLCPLAAIAQFNRNGRKILEPVVMLSIVGPLMYLCYPASVGDGEPWCYQAVQTMFYHGVQLAWGILSIALGAVRPNIRKCWQSGVLLVCITLWAKLGNLLLEHNWFFLNEDAFYIGLVEGGILPKWSLMIINPLAVFLTVLAVYGICALVQSKSKKAVFAG